MEKVHDPLWLGLLATSLLQAGSSSSSEEPHLPDADFMVWMWGLLPLNCIGDSGLISEFPIIPHNPPATVTILGCVTNQHHIKKTNLRLLLEFSGERSFLT